MRKLKDRERELIVSGLIRQVVQRKSAIACWIVATYVLGSIQGCGESQQDLFMKHAQRDRGGSSGDEETPAPPPPPKPAARPEQVAAKPSPRAVETSAATSTTDPAASEVVEPAPEESGSLSEIVGIKPIEERKPEKGLSIPERRRRAFKNITKINDALYSYLQKNGRFPTAYRTAPGGMPSLSWRVELLPYLGYEKLYQKFDFQRPWNMPPNKELLQFIPDEYVSPERFDEKTNYVVPADPVFMFGENRIVKLSRIDDGPENTIMLLEVNDPHAVNWTEPKDFAPKSHADISKYLGKVRQDGTFALWANGFPTLLETGLTNMQLYQALTFKKNDALRGSQIHRPISIEQADDDPDFQDSLSQEQVAGGEMVDGGGLNTTGLKLPPKMEEREIVRQPVPSAVQLSTAQNKLRRIFRDKLEEAKSAADKGKLASELLTTAADMEADAAGAFALQQAALRLAIESSDGGILIEAIDQRVARFDVDSFQENLKWIQAFGQETASRDSSTVKGDDILERAMPVIYAGVRENEYMLASSVARRDPDGNRLILYHAGENRKHPPWRVDG